ncbi:MAG: hypothetical protein GEU90_14360 [Gemmatimonas sp.]|nr:hypothetical protein [Gemmatimonas sp.]
MDARRVTRIASGEPEGQAIASGPGRGRVAGAGGRAPGGATLSGAEALIPVEVQAGSLLEIGSLVVTDTFGVRTRIRPFHDVDGPNGEWRVFPLSEDSVDCTSSSVPIGNRLFLPPVLAAPVHGRPVEDVHFLRDEMANLAWAVEHKVENVRGRPLDRHERYLANRPDPAELIRAIPHDADMAYRLLTESPRALDSPRARTRPGGRRNASATRAMLQLSGNGSGNGRGSEVRPIGRLLEPNRDLRLFEEEVPRAGAHVIRAFQLARWSDGSTHLWLARHKRPGRGEGWSGLRFDVVEPARRE